MGCVIVLVSWWHPLLYTQSDNKIHYPFFLMAALDVAVNGMMFLRVFGTCGMIFATIERVFRSPQQFIQIYVSAVWWFLLWMKNANKQSSFGFSQKPVRITKRLGNNCKQFMASMLCEIQLWNSGHGDFVLAETQLKTRNMKDNRVQHAAQTMCKNTGCVGAQGCWF